MGDRPVYLGKGRGRGRGSQPGSPTEPYPGRASGPQKPYAKGKRNGPVSEQVSVDQIFNCRSTSASSASEESEQSTPSTPSKTPSTAFENAAAKHQKSVMRHLDTNKVDGESSEEEDDLDDEGIMDSLLKTFRSTGDVDLGITKGYIENSMRSKAHVCLICIETIKRTDPVWNCHGCFSMFHISCIQKWIKDGVYQQVRQTDDDESIDPKSIPWHCPKCRHEYQQSECPRRYYCFCGKEEDPEFDPWLVPHSCGQTCEKQLKPECGHICLLLCHPGPCPPCPQTVRVTCHCGKLSPQTRRCGAREWSCGKACGKHLHCGLHTCATNCHAGECPPCPATSEQPCQCGNETKTRPCSTPEWQCGKVCGKKLSCGQHVCEQVCHSGDCGTCPRAGKRTCPCGKTVFDLPCTEDVPTCPDTCGKMLGCDLHECTQRCHIGPCGTCRQMTVKTCRCGLRQKEIQCYKEYTCETKCTKMKDCRKHPCKRKCCDGNCPPCEMTCGKHLGCHNHKCSSLCHRGPCYPCPETVTISCACGGTSITVPCGREKVTKPPRCKLPCKKPPDCHHPERVPHKCHPGRCPACKQTCGKALSDCTHTCPAPCHTAVLKKIQNQVKRAGPWEPEPESKVEMVEVSCPPCEVPVSVTCLGGHETVSLKCFMAQVYSCKRQCGRSLSCTNHVCTLECHEVIGAVDNISAGKNCQKCDSVCEKPRPEGCTHPCLLACHRNECPPCKQMIRMRCHCSLVVQHVECNKWTDASDREKQKLKACPSRCPKILPCKHQCTAFCHPGLCPSPEKCTEKVKMKCPCKTRRRDFVCNEVQAGLAKVECDDFCTQKKLRQQKENEEKEKAEKERELQKQKEELEEFERKMRPKKKQRKRKAEEKEQGLMERHKRLLVASLLVLLFSIFIFYLLSTN